MRELTGNVTYSVRTHHEADGSLWAEVVDLPGCFASGFTQEELEESLAEAIGLYLSDENRTVTVRPTEGHEVESLEERKFALA